MGQPGSTFFRNRYPKKAANGRTDFTPSINGESYLAATDCTELLVGMKSLLPRLLALGQSRGWEQATLALWRQMYEDLPDLPRGSIVIHKKFADDKFSGNFITSHGWGSPLSLEKSELLAPVRQLSPAYSQAYDRENPELYSIWPGKLMLRDKKGSGRGDPLLPCPVVPKRARRVVSRWSDCRVFGPQGRGETLLALLF